MTSIFVAKLDFGIGNDELRQAFARFGTVLKATVATDRETGKSRGFGFVEMANAEEAREAIKALDGSLLNGRPIAVKEAEQRPDNRGPRDQSSRDSNRPVRDQQPRNDRPNREDDRIPIQGDAPAAPFIPPFESSKIEPKRKKEDKKGKPWDDDKGMKKPKMNAYKKSGKHSRFFDEDEDDDFELDNLNSLYSNDDLDETEDDFEDED